MSKTYRDLLNALQELEHYHPELICQEILAVSGNDVVTVEEFNITVRDATNMYLQKQNLPKLEIKLEKF